MAPYVALAARANADGSSGGLPTIAIIGFIVAGLLLLAVGIWFLVSFIRKRAQKKREAERGAAFLTVKGVVKESMSSIGPLPA